jgi:hypothetical protein
LTDKTKFFSKQNIYKAIWALLIALVGFVGGKIYQGVYGPQKVVIDSKSSPVYVKIHETDSDKLAKEIGSIRKDISNIKVYSDYLGGKDNAINKSLPTKYELPKNVKGYFVVPILGVTDSSRVDSKHAKGKPIIISFSLRDKNLLSNATPTIVEILRIVSKAEVMQVLRNDYELLYGKNNILIDVDLLKGEYKLRYGYFMKDELRNEFPNFYSKEFDFKVLE